MSDYGYDQPVYRPVTSNPVDAPDPPRVNLIREKPGTPFEHFCAVCGAWGGFGFDGDRLKQLHATWYCGDHRAEGERHFKAGTLPAPRIVAA